MIYEKPNVFNSRINRNKKLENAREIIDELEVDVLAYSEHILNCKHRDNRNGFLQAFRVVEEDILSIAAHNVQGIIGRVQEGGTIMLLYVPLGDQYYFEHSDKDDTGLGRWVVMVFQGSEGIKTRIVCGYSS